MDDTLPGKPDQAYEALFATFSLDKTMASDAITETLVNKRQGDVSLVSLPLVRTQFTSSEHCDLKIGATLGEGGMGLVRSATQHPIGRNVAVKTLREGKESNEFAVLLLQEAIITGRLEHPNVVPIYGVGRDEEGAPVIVMKRIEGQAWTEFLWAPESAPGYEEQGPLNWNLHVLMQVCKALTFAHDRGIIHRDIKPDNVMIGEFGEVYLVDWGIAVTTKDDSFLPTAANVSSPSGTPAFMAPEMAAGQGDKITQATDVYLLGAVLHYILTQTPPHEGNSLYAIMLQAYKSEMKSYPESVPAKLAAICQKAMACEPADRFQTASEFREAIREFLDHRHGIQISNESALRLGELKAAVNDALGGSDNADVGIQRLFGECRFGFEQSLTIWPDNVDAQQGIQAALHTMFDFEIHQRSPKAAAMILAEMSEPSEELQGVIDALEASLREEANANVALAHLRRESDPVVGAKVRGVFIALVLFFLILIPSMWMGDLKQVSLEFFLWIGRITVVVTGLLLAFLHFVVFQRKPTKLNFTLGVTIGVATFFLWLVREFGAVMGVSVREIVVFESLAFFMSWVQLGIAVDRRILPLGGLYLASAIGIVFFDMPHLSWYLSCQFTALALTALIWTRPPR